MLTQAEADRLTGLPKTIECPKNVRFPFFGDKRDYGVIAANKKDRFTVGVSRSRADLTKCTYQAIYKKDMILTRLDVGDGLHTNPNGESLAGAHLHVYREGFEDRWAFPLPESFSDDMNLATKFFEFLKYCNITNAGDVTLQEVI